MAEKLHEKRFGLACGILWGAIVFVWTLIAAGTGFGAEVLTLWGTFHPGYTVSWVGSIVGLIYAVIFGFIGGYVFAWLYNWLAKKVK